MLPEWLWLGFEIIAVVAALAYLLLAVKQHISCWYAAALSVSLYLVIFFYHAQLLFDALLQIYYLGMAYYGYRTWSNAAGQAQSELRIASWPILWHLVAVLIICLLSFIAGHIASTYTEAKLPYLDAWTTLASVFATLLVVRKILENWLYWLVIDAVSIYLYIDRGLYLTVLLFACYTIIAWFGWLAWRRSYLASPA